MMSTKIILITACLVAFISVSTEAKPLEDDDIMIDNMYEVDDQHVVRQKRLTCDLLSFGGKINHSACAAHCLVNGKAGGRCNDGVCLCRETNFGDLFG